MLAVEGETVTEIVELLGGVVGWVGGVVEVEEPDLQAASAKQRRRRFRMRGRMGLVWGNARRRNNWPGGQIWGMG